MRVCKESYNSSRSPVMNTRQECRDGGSWVNGNFFSCIRSRWVRACNSTIFLSWCFHRPIFLDRISQEWDSRGSAMSNHMKLIWRHCVTGPELPFFHKRMYDRNSSVCKNAVTVWELHSPTHRLLVAGYLKPGSKYKNKNLVLSNEVIMVELPPWKI